MLPSFAAGNRTRFRERSSSSSEFRIFFSSASRECDAARENDDERDDTRQFYVFDDPGSCSCSIRGTKEAENVTPSPSERAGQMTGRLTGRGNHCQERIGLMKCGTLRASGEGFLDRSPGSS